MRLRRESVAHFAAPTPNALTVDAMLGKDLFARVAFIVIVIDLGRLRLRSVKCRTSGSALARRHLQGRVPPRCGDPKIPAKRKANAARKTPRTLARMELRILTNEQVSLLFDLLDTSEGNVVITTREALTEAGASEDVAFDRLLDLADTLEFRVSLAFALTPTDEFLSELAGGDAD
jgi:hypothetical protein